MNKDAEVEAVVEAGWQAVRDDGRVRAEPLEAAYREPRLWQLFEILSRPVDQVF
ncbi:hypothetical protein [Streptomyces acidicola]|uniref:hypothetical protein n=1 Tax=Streptomyces acidicola TaxID=2596892 RepID=UPI003443DD39